VIYYRQEIREVSQMRVALLHNHYDEVEYSDDTFETDGEEYVISEVCDASYDAGIIEF